MTPSCIIPHGRVTADVAKFQHVVVVATSNLRVLQASQKDEVHEQQPIPKRLVVWAPNIVTSIDGFHHAHHQRLLLDDGVCEPSDPSKENSVARVMNSSLPSCSRWNH